MINQILETFSRFNQAVTLTPTHLAGKDLPLIIRENYDFLEAKLQDRPVSILLALSKTNFNVIQLKAHWELIEKAANKSVILILQSLNTREKERLIKRGVPFIIPGKFIHAKILGISGEATHEPKHYEDLLKREALSPWAETILIKELLDGSVNGKAGSEIAALFAVTPIVISQAIHELELHGLCSHTRSGKKKILEFEVRKNLWWNSLRILKSPVIGSVPIGDSALELVRAGETALAHYSMLADTKAQTFSISKREFLQLKNKGVITLKMLDDEKHELQLWRRDPKLLATNGFADRISVYCSLRHSSDARVQQEFTKMMAEIGLEVPDESR